MRGRRLEKPERIRWNTLRIFRPRTTQMFADRLLQ